MTFPQVFDRADAWLAADPGNGAWLAALWTGIDARDHAAVRRAQDALRLPPEVRPAIVRGGTVEEEAGAGVPPGEAAPAPAPADPFTSRPLLGAYARRAARGRG